MNHVVSNTLIRHIISLCLTIPLSGCVGGGAMTYSEMAVVDNSLDKGLLKVQGLSVAAIPYNYYLPLVALGLVLPIIPVGFEEEPSNTEKPLQIAFECDAENSFVFEPRKFILKYEGKEYIPTRISSRGKATEFRRGFGAEAIQAHDWGCNYSPWGPLTWEIENEQLEIPIGKSCYIIEFPINTLHPDRNFSIVIQGIKTNGSYVHFPEIHFKKAYTSHFGGFLYVN